MARGADDAVRPHRFAAALESACHTQDCYGVDHGGTCHLLAGALFRH